MTSASSPGTLGRTGLRTSVIGFGCYRIDDRVPEHHAALKKALLEGCNLIDTSSNYSDGFSEICVGKVLRDIGPQKDKIIVVSKAGYVQGQNLKLASEREKEGRAFPEMVKYMEGCWHCIHPTFLADQLERSLQRLQLKSLDVYLLHNPEYFLSDALHRGTSAPLTKVREEFYRRIRNAFAYLEDEVSKGRIKSYGVSSNTFVSPQDDFEATSATEMWDIAQKLASAHHFSVIQMPGNLFEAGAILEKNNGPGHSQTVLEFAATKSLGVLINRPLNVIIGNHLLRLSDYSPQCDVVTKHLDPFLPQSLRRESLSRKCLAVLVNTPGISCVLNGMRKTQYVEDSLGVMQLGPFPVATALYEAFLTASTA